MTEILTESFCERCGTRYTFESVAPRQRRIGGIKVLGQGLKNFVMSDDSSLDEAMAAARSDAERESTAQQLDAFHRTFNFCMSCRQYTCGNCWNEAEARCLSCAPIAGMELLEAAPAEADLERLLRLTSPASAATWPAETHVHTHADGTDELLPLADGAVEEAAAEPEVGLDELLAARLAFGSEPEPEAFGTPVEPIEPVEPVEAAAPAVEAEPLVAEPAQATVPLETEPEPVEGETEPVAAELVEALRAAAEEPAAAETEGEPAGVSAADAGLPHVAGLEPGSSLEDAIAAYEASLEAAIPGPGRGVDVVEQPTWPFALAPQPPAAPEAEVPEEAVEAEPEAPAAELLVAEPEPEAQPAEVALEPEAEPEPVAAVEPAPVPETPAAPTEPVEAPAPAAPAAPFLVPELPTVPEQPLAAEPPSGPPQWPVGPRWPTAIPARSAPPPPTTDGDALTAIMAHQATEAMWAASSRDVVQAPLVAHVAPVAGVAPCVSCGISLSANARFCRRCGTAQGG